MSTSFDLELVMKWSLTREDCVFQMASTTYQRKMCENDKTYWFHRSELHCITLVQHAHDCKQRDGQDGKKAGRQAWGTSCSCCLRSCCLRSCWYHFSARESDCSKGYIGMFAYIGITIWGDTHDDVNRVSRHVI